jgi:8-oxo-dGTP diphosphatase
MTPRDSPPPISPPRIRVVAALVASGGRYLITQRRPTAVLPLLWEFPGGRVEPGETDEQALAREIRHRLDVDISVGKLIGFVKHPYERYIVELHLYECELVHGEPREANVHAFQWVASTEFDRYPFTPADELSMAQLLGID